MKKYFEKIYKKSSDEFNNIVKQSITNNNKMFIVTANPETLMIAEKNEKFKNALLDNNTIIIPDGIGIVKGAKILGYNIKETIPRVELCSKLFEYCNEFNKSIYLLGAKEEIVSKLANVINANYPNAIIAGFENGYCTDKQKSFNKIIELKPDVVLVALGIPEQELLIYNNLNKFDKGIFVGVGGSFDVLSGTKKRAPKIFRKFHLEWLYRIMKEPKRFKRFFNSNVKYLLNLLNTSIFDILFLFILIIILFLGLFRSIFFPKDISYYENRPSNKFSSISISDFINGNLQDNIELVLADQIPFSQTMKKNYNIYNNSIKHIALNLFFKKYSNSIYFYLGNGIYKYGQDNNLIYGQKYLSTEQSSLDNKIDNINKLITLYPDLDFYLYYIEKDTDINFITNTKSAISSYIFNNINLSKEYLEKFEINSFDEFKENFYKTDHHLNYKGSYLGYSQILNMLEPNSSPAEILDTKLLSDKFSGSKASLAGITSIYKEPFYAYKFNLPIHDTYINGKKSVYGHNDDIQELINTEQISYGLFYGSDDGEIIFDYNNPEKENILIFGESYDNAIIELLASHFNKTYSIDLRAYEMDLGHKFDFDTYVKNNNISKILFVGSAEFYIMDKFILEVP